VVGVGDDPIAEAPRRISAAECGPQAGPPPGTSYDRLRPELRNA
jgi:hypothetical protein